MNSKNLERRAGVPWRTPLLVAALMALLWSTCSIFGDVPMSSEKLPLAATIQGHGTPSWGWYYGQPATVRVDIPLPWSLSRWWDAAAVPLLLALLLWSVSQRRSRKDGDAIAPYLIPIGFASAAGPLGTLAAALLLGCLLGPLSGDGRGVRSSIRLVADVSLFVAILYAVAIGTVPALLMGSAFMATCGGSAAALAALRQLKPARLIATPLC